MSGLARRKNGGEETFPTICPRCYTRGELRLRERPGISMLHLKADGTIEREDEAKEQGMELGLVCPKCNRKYWMDIGFVAGKAPDITVHTAPQMSMSENAKVVEPVEVSYSREKRWWFAKKEGKEVEIRPGELSE